MKRKDASGTDDICVAHADDMDNALSDLGYTPSGFASAYNSIDAGYYHVVDFTQASNSSLSTGLFGNGYTAHGVYSSPTSSNYSSASTTSGVSTTFACFVAGTSVQSEDCSKAIEDISVGDKVWAWNEETGDVALKEVVETYVNETSELVHVFVNGEEIVTTPFHPFYSPVKGWTDAVHLRAGDILVLVNGEYVVVEKVQHEILEAPIEVYNFQVKDYHTYYVGKNSILVHNMCDANSGLPKDGIELDSSDALDLADDFLGNGYSEMSPGRFVSSDGLRQVRMTSSDLSTINNHAGAPHINFETLIENPLRPGKFQITGNSHVFIVD